MTRCEKAKELFLKGYNCSQSVLGAFSDVMGMDHDTVMKLASSFGGGIARLREVCGTCSAMFMVAGMVCGYTEYTAQAKSEHYAFVQEMAKAFEARNGSIICRELLKLRAQASKTVDNGTSPIANERSDDYYRTRPCLAVVVDAVDITCEMLSLSQDFPD